MVATLCVCVCGAYYVISCILSSSFFFISIYIITSRFVLFVYYTNSWLEQRVNSPRALVLLLHMYFNCIFFCFFFFILVIYRVTRAWRGLPIAMSLAHAGKSLDVERNMARAIELRFTLLLLFFFFFFTENI